MKAARLVACLFLSVAALNSAHVIAQQTNDTATPPAAVTEFSCDWLVAMSEKDSRSGSATSGFAPAARRDHATTNAGRSPSSPCSRFVVASSAIA